MGAVGGLRRGGRLRPDLEQCGARTAGLPGRTGPALPLSEG
ncbi:hypothetical protein [Streptomyces antimycoticus]|nr:hypothetical protein [Streptomyces antimycoticus]WJD96854.1 hypothetical protein QR300_13170 [Streptomyces antimycoticus]